MELLNEFEQLEIIKEQFPNDYIIQEENMKDYLADISKSIIDSDNINYTFASLVSSYLSKSNFERFGAAYCDDTTVYASDKGDCFTVMHILFLPVDSRISNMCISIFLLSRFVEKYFFLTFFIVICGKLFQSVLF